MLVHVSPRKGTGQKPNAQKASRRAKKDYAAKRSFEKTPEPQSEVEGDVDPGVAPPGVTFVIHQHYARRLHFDLRLEMLNGKTPVLVSWAVPKGLPRKKGVRTLAIHVEDHPFEYGSFAGTIPKDEYGAGEVRIFDSGRYEMLEQKPGKLTFRLEGRRLNAVYHLLRTGRGADDRGSEKEQWLTLLSEDLRGPPEEPPEPRPMLAALVSDPFDDDRWAFEPKWDGVRAIAICDEQTRLVSRNSKDITVAYPELQDLHERLVAHNAMLDGEIVAMDTGRPSFEKLQSRMHVRNEREIARLAQTTPVTFVAFDLIYLDGKSLVTEPFEERRRLLEETLVPSESVLVSPSFRGSGVKLFEAAKAQNLEGIIAKKIASKYEVGRRAKTWLKIKTVFDAEVIIGGWTEGEGSRGGRIGALLLGAYQDGVLKYIGSVGTGFDERSLKTVQSKLSQIADARTPFSESTLKGEPNTRRANWVRPELVARVEFRELTSAGKLRAPSFKALLEDKSPEECLFDQLMPAPRAS